MDESWPGDDQTHNAHETSGSLTQTCFNRKPAFFSVASHWILSHTACVSKLPGSRILLAVILPKNFSTDWRGISFSRALHTYRNNHIFWKNKATVILPHTPNTLTCLDFRWSVSSCSLSSLCSSIKLMSSVSSQLCLTFSTTSRYESTLATSSEFSLFE